MLFCPLPTMIAMQRRIRGTKHPQQLRPGMYSCSTEAFVSGPVRRSIVMGARPSLLTQSRCLPGIGSPCCCALGVYQTCPLQICVTQPTWCSLENKAKVLSFQATVPAKASELPP